MPAARPRHRRPEAPSSPMPTTAASSFAVRSESPISPTVAGQLVDDPRRRLAECLLLRGKPDVH